MFNLEDTVRGQCPDVDPHLVSRHFRSLPATYWERYAAADIARHVRLLSKLAGANPVEVDIRPLASQTFDVLVAGIEQSGILACVTAALTAYGFDIEDVQISAYLDMGEFVDAGAESRFFLLVLRVSGQLRGQAVSELTDELANRLRMAFAQLAQGNLLGAQTVAADNRAGEGNSGPDRVIASEPRKIAGYDGLILGGDFRLENKLASGGMSEIYLATQLSLNRTVAVKLSHHEGATEDELLARFHQEAMVLAQFSCPHIVQILTAGIVPDLSGGALAWMAMEYMAGGDLGSWLERQGPTSAELATRWLRQALDGLLYAHQRAVLHRDLKPNNLLVTAEGHLKISDFGLLKQAGRTAANLTSHITLRGTPLYMSPEQALGEGLDERSDIFSLGSTFFHLITGRLPFDKPNITAVLVQIAQQDAPRLTDMRPDAPRPLAAIVGRMMARHREERYQEVGVILEDLSSYERRGLLNFSENNSFIPVAPVLPRDKLGGETQPYFPAAFDSDYQLPPSGQDG